MSTAIPIAAGTRMIDRRKMWGAGALVVALAAGLVAWFGWGDGAPARITCVGFETAEDPNFTYALMKVSNRSGRSLSLLTPKPETWPWQFSPRAPSDAELRLSDGNIDLRHGRELPADGSETNWVLLPNDGRRGRLLMPCWRPVEVQRRPAFIRHVRDWLGLQSRGGFTLHWVQSEQEIQCPRVRPDGTVEPARIVR